MVVQNHVTGTNFPQFPDSSWRDKEMYNTNKAPTFLGAILKTGFSMFQYSLCQKVEGT